MDEEHYFDNGEEIPSEPAKILENLAKLNKQLKTQFNTEDLDEYKTLCDTALKNNVDPKQLTQYIDAAKQYIQDSDLTPELKKFWLAFFINIQTDLNQKKIREGPREQIKLGVLNLFKNFPQKIYSAIIKGN